MQKGKQNNIDKALKVSDKSHNIRTHQCCSNKNEKTHVNIQEFLVDFNSVQW